MIYLLTAIGLTPGGNSTVLIYTNNRHKNKIIQNTQNKTYVTIRIHKHYNQCTYRTKLNRSIQNIQTYVKLYKMEQKLYEKCDERNNHICNKSHMINIAFINVGEPVTKIFTHFTALLDTSLPIN